MPRRLSPKQFTLLTSAYDLESLSLIDCGLTDSQLVQILNRQPNLSALQIDDNPLSEKVIPAITALPRLKLLSMDCENIDLATLSQFAVKLNNPDLATNTALRQIEREFLGEERRVSGAADAVHRFWRYDREDESRPQRLSSFDDFDALRTSEHASSHLLEARYVRVDLRHLDNSGEAAGGELSLGYWSTDRSPSGNRIWSNRLQKKLEAVGPLTSIKICNLGESWQPPTALSVRDVSVDVITPSVKHWLESTRPQRVAISMGPAFKNSVSGLAQKNCRSLSIRPGTNALGEDFEPISDEVVARVLNGLRDVDDLVLLEIHGFRKSEPGPLVTIDFSRFQNLNIVHLSNLAVDDRSVESLSELTQIGRLSLENLPHVTHRSLIATTKLPQLRSLSWDLDVDLSPMLIKAICESETLLTVTLPFKDPFDSASVLPLTKICRIRVAFRSRERLKPNDNVEDVEKREQSFAQLFRREQQKHCRR